MFISIIFFRLKFFLILWLILFYFSTSKKVCAIDNFYAKNNIILDLKLDLIWLRCSVGQIWDGKTCKGKAIKIKMEQMKEVLKQANEQLGSGWRLPTRKELESLVCKTCNKVKINENYFPNTSYEPYWTGERNNWHKNFYWSVNFFTGHTFGRFPGNIPNFVRLVKNK